MPISKLTAKLFVHQSLEFFEEGSDQPHLVYIFASQIYAHCHGSQNMFDIG